MRLAFPLLCTALVILALMNRREGGTQRPLMRSFRPFGHSVTSAPLGLGPQRRDIIGTVAGEARISVASLEARRIASLPVTTDTTLELCRLMMKWAGTHPVDALTWWHSPEQDAAAAAGFHVSEPFYMATFAAMAKRDLVAGRDNFRTPDSVESRLSALHEVARVAAAQDRLQWLIDNPPPDGEWSDAERIILMFGLGNHAEAAEAASNLPPGNEAAWLAGQLPKTSDD